jgi:enoyl-CoA hydratase/carnithine racemase
VTQAPVLLRRRGDGCAELIVLAPRLDPEVCAAALPLLEALAEQDDLRVATLHGGRDESSIAGPWPLPPERPALEALRPLRACVEAVAALPMPVLAVLDGPVRGEALELALACDLRLASLDAAFVMPHLAEGRLPCCGGSQRLSRLVGLSAAFELFLSDGWQAERALRLGLITGAVPAEALAGEALRWADALAARAPIAARFLKEVVRRGMEVPLEQGLLIEEDAYLLLQTTEDRKEGIRAFLEKRPPRFRGK